MLKHIQVSHPTGKLTGSIQLAGSKSISNRVLIIQALCDEAFDIAHISTSDDTTILQALISSGEEILDAHHAGTTFRFLTAFLALKTDKAVVLTGSSRMQERPVGPLVTALNSLGANIEYLHQPGFPPLKISPFGESRGNEISIPGNISSQFISALLLVAPSLPHGLRLNIEGALVSAPYVTMTRSLMLYFGVKTEVVGHTILVKPQKYKGRDIVIEGDWSSAAYFYALAALSASAEISIDYVRRESLQSDKAIIDLAERFGVETKDTKTGIKLSKKPVVLPTHLRYNFLECPDLAQTIMVLCGVLGVKCDFTGLQTLRIKETDRLAAMQTELSKIGIKISLGKDSYHTLGSVDISDNIVNFDTYQDHRMALSLATLGMLKPVIIKNPEVVSKSFPSFWRQLKKLGFDLV